MEDRKTYWNSWMNLRVIGASLLVLSILASIYYAQMDSIHEQDVKTIYLESEIQKYKSYPVKPSVVVVATFKDGIPLTFGGMATVKVSLPPRVATGEREFIQMLLSRSIESVAAKITSEEAIHRTSEVINLIRMTFVVKVYEYRSEADVSYFDMYLILPDESINLIQDDKLKRAWEEFKKHKP